MASPAKRANRKPKKAANKTAQSRKKVAAKKSATKLLGFEAARTTKRPQAKSGPRPSSRPWGQAGRALGGVGVNATSPDALKRAVNAAMDSGNPTLINAVIDPAAGSESGRIGNLNPQSALRKK